MLRRLVPIAILVAPLLAVSPSNADPWKDESGRGKQWKEDWGETPWWGRGKGYWDGHFKHEQWRRPHYVPAPRYYRYAQPYYYGPPAPRHYYAPPPTYYEHWRHEFYQPAPMEYWPY